MPSDRLSKLAARVDALEERAAALPEAVVGLGTLFESTTDTGSPTADDDRVDAGAQGKSAESAVAAAVDSDDARPADESFDPPRGASQAAVEDAVRRVEEGSDREDDRIAV